MLVRTIVQLIGIGGPPAAPCHKVRLADFIASVVLLSKVRLIILTSGTATWPSRRIHTWAKKYGRPQSTVELSQLQKADIRLLERYVRSLKIAPSLFEEENLAATAYEYDVCHAR